MARDYVKNGLRSGEQVTIKTDRISEDGAYVCIPVEALDTVKKHIIIAVAQGELAQKIPESGVEYLYWVLGLIEKELFPEEEEGR